jgi:cbb3-type cytochrome oxidase cytochrome c subunit
VFDRWNDSPKPGPSLYHLASKTNKDWTYNWILEPRSFRHNTWMPHFFKKGNNSAPKDLKQTEQEVLAITEYLFSTATPYKTADVYYAGDQEKGRVLVNSLGCMGCHQIQPDPDPEYNPSVDAIRTEQGPNLIRLGSKVNRQWLLGWLKNPYSYGQKLLVDRFRISGSAAADITALTDAATNTKVLSILKI